MALQEIFYTEDLHTSESDNSSPY